MNESEPNAKETKLGNSSNGDLLKDRADVALRQGRAGGGRRGAEGEGRGREKAKRERAATS